MENAQIQKLIDELATAPQEHSPRMQICQGKPQGYIFLAANRDALIRLARLFLAAAMTPIDPVSGARHVEIDVESVVVDEKSDLILCSVEHTSTVPISEIINAERDRQAWKNDRFMVMGCWTVGIGSLFLLVSGLVFWIALLTGDWK